MYPETWQSPICLLLFYPQAIWKSGFLGCSWSTEIFKMLMTVCVIKWAQSPTTTILDQEQSSLGRVGLLEVSEQSSCRHSWTGLVQLARGPTLRVLLSEEQKTFDCYTPRQFIFVFPGRKAHLVDVEPLEQTQTKSAHQPFEKWKHF